MNYIKIDSTSISNGLGIRVVLWISGCKVHCKNCFNKETWDFKAGKIFDESSRKELVHALNKSYIKGLTISGGNPLEPENMTELVALLRRVKNDFPNKDIWLYTGYTFEYLLNTMQPHYAKILNYIDVLVDGPFIEEKKDITLPFRGSSNQRLIDMKKTLASGRVVELELSN